VSAQQESQRAVYDGSGDPVVGWTIGPASFWLAIEYAASKQAPLLAARRTVPRPSSLSRSYLL
jgi:hypothetical protein